MCSKFREISGFWTAILVFEFKSKGFAPPSKLGPIPETWAPPSGPLPVPDRADLRYLYCWVAEFPKWYGEPGFAPTGHEASSTYLHWLKYFKVHTLQTTYLSELGSQLQY